MVGCMVETSLGVSHSMQLKNVDLYDLDGHLMIQDEPFLLCDENDGKLSLKFIVLVCIFFSRGMVDR